jgi:hypothetical protein
MRLENTKSSTQQNHGHYTERILNNRLAFILFFFLLSPVSFGKKLPKLMTKQDLSNLRFISEDGRFSYYQMKSGKLFLSLNYQISEVLSYAEGTQYEILGSNTKEFLLVSAAPKFHQHLSPRKNKKLFIVPYGLNEPTFLGDGSFPRFQLNSTWASYYDSLGAVIYFKNLITPAVSFFIELNNKLSKYFVPETVMLTKDKILYTDVNKDGNQGLLLFDRQTRKPRVIYKLATNSQKLELCEYKGKTYIGEFNLTTSKKSSKIYVLEHNPNYKTIKLKNIYKSKKEDIGNIVCNIDEESLYFIKDYSNATEMIFDVAKLDLKTNKVERLTHMKKIFQFVQMDKRLLAPYQGEYLVIKGESNNKTNDQLKR